MEYENTPSFYSNEEFFNKYLGRTSYYCGLQRVVKAVIKITKPRYVMELGSALGTTTLEMARKYKDISFTGYDIRDDIVKKANEGRLGLNNVEFRTGDMSDVVKIQEINKFDLIFLIYSFHHIEDPLNRKIEFLRNCYSNMKNGGYLLIAETFLPEECSTLDKNDYIKKLFNRRALEGYASTFWNTVESIGSIDTARKIAEVSYKNETDAGELVYRRKEEYLVKFSWLNEKAKECGFKVILSEPVNCIMEKAILLQK